MAINTNEVAALLAIQPKYSDAIFSGNKYIEFRKKGFKHPIKLVIVYTSSPVKKVIGYFSVGKIVCKTPKDLWDEFGAVGSISKDAFFEYYQGKTKAFGIVIERAETFEKPISLKRLGKDWVPPQSFRYISSKVVRTLGLEHLSAA